MEAPASPPVAPLGEVAGQQSNHMLHWDRPLLPDTTQPQFTTEGDEDGDVFLLSEWLNMGGIDNTSTYVL